VRILARSVAITILEGRDEPLAPSNTLTREIKTVLADALTWAPEYPGIGRVPRMHSGVVHGPLQDLGAGDIDAALENMLDGDHGKRTFGLRGEMPGESLSGPGAGPP
jgi:pyruvate-ferredoxin/flavodoxin oxidoreductase